MAAIDVYARISDDRTGRRAGVERQIKDASELVRRRGHSIGETHVDNDLSASRFSRKQRPGYQALMQRIAHHQIAGFAAFHTDRLYRQLRELEDVIELVEKRDLVAFTCEGDFDLGTADGRMMARMLVTFAAKEADDTSRRLEAMHAHRARAGRVSGGGRRPFGFEADGMTVRLDEAALIREAADRVLAGDSQRSIVEDWRRSGVPTVTGAAWRATTVQRVLLSPRIAGLRAHRGKLVRRDDGEPVQAVWPAIVPPEKWWRVRAVLATRREQHQAMSSREPYRYLLSGIVMCARCDVAMTAQPNRRHGRLRRRYVCRRERGGCDRNGIAAEQTEAQVEEMIAALVRDKQARQRQPPAGGEEQQLVDALSAAEAELDQWATDHAEGSVSRMAYLAAAKAIEKRVEGLRRQLRRERVELVVVEIGDDPWESLGFDQRRRLVEHYVERIVVQPVTRGGKGYDPGRWLSGIVWRNHTT